MLFTSYLKKNFASAKAVQETDIGRQVGEDASCHKGHECLARKGPGPRRAVRPALDPPGMRSCILDYLPRGSWEGLVGFLMSGMGTLLRKAPESRRSPSAMQVHFCPQPGGSSPQVPQSWRTSQGAYSALLQFQGTSQKGCAEPSHQAWALAPWHECLSLLLRFTGWPRPSANHPGAQLCPATTSGKDQAQPLTAGAVPQCVDTGKSHTTS